jgi:DNA-binding NarL/FixJ family response regulator
LLEEPTLDVICQTGSGEEAVSKAAELQPDVVLMDISLRGISGIEAARQILFGALVFTRQCHSGDSTHLLC